MMYAFLPSYFLALFDHFSLFSLFLFSLFLFLCGKKPFLRMRSNTLDFPGRMRWAAAETRLKKEASTFNNNIKQIWRVPESWFLGVPRGCRGSPPPSLLPLQEVRLT